VVVRSPRVLIAVAFLAIGLMYCTNHDMGGDDRSPRGDGVYRPVLARGDGHLLYLMTQSLALDGDLDYDDELAQFGDPFTQGRTVVGRAGIPHPIGLPLVWTPLLWTAQGSAAIANVFGAGIPMHGYTLWHQRIVFASSVLAAWLAILLGMWVARRTLGGRWGPAYAGVAILLGTSLTYYATYMPSYSHAVDAGAASGFLAAWALTLGRWDWRRVLLLGGLLGVAGLIRTQELALGIVVALEAGIVLVRRTTTWPDRARILGAGAAMLAVAAIVMIPQALAWRAVYGQWSALPQGPGFTRPAHPLVPELLFARNGWLSTHPLAYAGVLGLGLLAWRGPRIAPPARMIGVGLLGALVLQVYLNAIILDWWAGVSFGQRRLCSMTLPLVVGLATLIHQGGVWLARRSRRGWIGHVAVVVVLGWFVAWNLARVSNFREGRPVYGDSCCKQVTRLQRAIAQPIYDAIGNPFALPSSAIFAWRRGVPITRWERLHGDYPWVPATDYTPASIRNQAVVWSLGGPASRDYLVEGFGPSAPGPNRLVRPTTARHAEAVVPNLLPERLTMSLWLKADLAPGVVAAPIVVRWNGDVVVRATLDGQATTVTWSIQGDVGDNLLAIDGPIGLMVGELRFTAR